MRNLAGGLSQMQTLAGDELSEGLAARRAHCEPLRQPALLCVSYVHPR